METKLNFLSLDKLVSKKGSDYYLLTCLLDRSTCKIFISKETFENLSSRKFEYLKEYLAKFKVSNRFGSVNLDLIDLQ